MREPVTRLLLRLRFRAFFGSGGVVDSGQQSTDKHDQQVDFHGFLRCHIAANQPLQCKWHSSELR